MSEIIKIENVGYQPLLPTTSFTVDKGTITVIITTKEEIDACISRLIFGFIPPDQGVISVFGKPISTLSESQLSDFRQRIGLVYANGGLVSNLKIWENIVLPLAYMNRSSSADIESCAMAILNRLGFSGGLMQLPGLTSFSQKKMAGFARAMLMDPELMVYESPLQGLNHDERSLFLKIAQEFHGEKEGRSSLFISSTPAIVPMLKDAKVITIS